MEHELKDHLRRCAETYVASKDMALSTVGRLAAGDWRFFDRLDNDEKTFTARKYDEVICWFSENWPESAEWPAGVVRPEPDRVAS